MTNSADTRDEVVCINPIIRSLPVDTTDKTLSVAARSAHNDPVSKEVMCRLHRAIFSLRHKNRGLYHIERYSWLCSM